ncbi:hypothetical protein C3R44_24130, partial [Mycobacterium tuberculosis]
GATRRGGPEQAKADERQHARQDAGGHDGAGRAEAQAATARGGAAQAGAAGRGGGEETATGAGGGDPDAPPTRGAGA